jgi:hypothetical protein
MIVGVCVVRKVILKENEWRALSQSKLCNNNKPGIGPKAFSGSS